MGVLPLQFKDAMNRETLKLDGSETFELMGLAGGLTPGMDVSLHIHRADGSKEEVTVTCRIDTLDEIEYVKAGGILQYVLRNMNAGAKTQTFQNF